MTMTKYVILACSILISACSQPHPELPWLKQKTLDSLVFVEGGSFQMGDVGYTDENGEHQFFTLDDDNKYVHKVTLTSFHMQKYEVTVKEFDTFSEANGLEKAAKKFRNLPSMTPSKPMIRITWHQAQNYCQWVGEQLGIHMDLPTEAQWEYAARSRGLPVKYATDNGEFDRGRNVLNPSDNHNFSTMPPGSWPPNPLGLYDMTGNVNEWVRDTYIRTWSNWKLDNQVDPSGPSQEEIEKYYLEGGRIARGWGLAGEVALLYSRFSVPSDSTGQGIGFRCVAEVSDPEAITALIKSESQTTNP